MTSVPYRSVWRKIVDKYYPAGSLLRDIYLSHCEAVTKKAIEIADQCGLVIDRTLLTDASMLHDIGIFLTNAPGIHCTGDAPYIAHGILGAELLRREGADERVARVAERHTGSGLTAAEIADQNLPIPMRDYLPETLLERLVCYADKFFSKGGDRMEKPFGKVRASIMRHGDNALKRFDILAAEFTGKFIQ